MGDPSAVDPSAIDPSITNASGTEWLLFNVAVVCALLLDLLVVSDGGARGSKQAAVWTVVWVTVSLMFCAHLYFMYNEEVALNFLTGYVIEKSLSLDNLFVILLTFDSFRIQKADQHKVLFWGILSAIFLRGACIFAGLALIQRFEWMLQMFGVLLLVAVFRILTEEEEEDDDEGEFHGGGDDAYSDAEGGGSPTRSPGGGGGGSSKGMGSNGLLLRIIKLFFRVSEDVPRGQFFAKDETGAWCATPLFVALLVVEGSDIIFAADSIPAIFGVTTDPYVVYTSNICAILGLRSLYFILAEALENFEHIKYGLAAVLGFVAVKILIAPWFHVHAGVSLLIIIGILVLTAVLGGMIDDGKGHGKKSDGAGPGMPGSPSAGGGAGMGGGKTKVSARAAAQYGNVMQLVNTSNKRL